MARDLDEVDDDDDDDDTEPRNGDNGAPAATPPNVRGDAHGENDGDSDGDAISVKLMPGAEAAFAAAVVTEVIPAAVLQYNAMKCKYNTLHSALLSNWRR